MSNPSFLVENLFSDVQFTAHVVTASTEESRAEVWRVATGRRNPNDRWAAATENVASYITVNCGQSRPATMVVVDRGHNLHGLAVKVQTSPDGLTWTDLVTATVPLVTAVGGNTASANGCLTEEGAWVKSFSSVSAVWWRFWMPAVGAGLVQQVVGLWLGTSWTPQLLFDLPLSDEAQQLMFDESAPTAAGWRGAGSLSSARVGEIAIKLINEAEYINSARYHIRYHFHRYRRPMWILFDPGAAAERAVLAATPPGVLDFRYDTGWKPRQAKLPWVEHEPVLVR